MLANGAKLEYKTGETYTKLSGLKEIPEMGTEAEKVENTVLDDTSKKYEMGIGDTGDIVYKFKYEGASANSPYRLMLAKQTAGEVVEFKETLKDGTTTEFSGQVSVKRTGGGVNGVIDFDLSIALNSELAISWAS